MRVKGGRTEAKRHKKILKKAKGYRLSRSKIFRRAHESVLHSYQYSLRDRRKRRAQMRRLWIMRINAALHQEDLKYKDFINALKTKKIELDRKVLAEFATNFPDFFTSVIKASGLK